MRLLSVIRLLILAVGTIQDQVDGRRLHLRGVEVFGELSEPSMSSKSSSAIPSSQGFRQPVVLDCVYDLIDNVSNRNVFPIVKWFRNNDPTPFYQWLSHRNSRMFHHSYAEFVDTLYKHNDVPHQMFRAVRITHPVKELSGNFSCEVIDDDENVEESFQQVASHSLYIYDTPSPFELRLNFAEKQLNCQMTTSEPVDSVKVDLYRVDYDSLDVEVLRVRLNTTSIANHRAKNSSGWHSIEASATLQQDDTKVAQIGTSRTFLCDVIFTRVRNADSNDSLVFQRSIRIVHEAPLLADYEESSEVLPEAWSFSSGAYFTTSATSGKLLVGALLLLLMYI